MHFIAGMVFLDHSFARPTQRQDILFFFGPQTGLWSRHPDIEKSCPLSIPFASLIASKSTVIQESACINDSSECLAQEVSAQGVSAPVPCPGRAIARVSGMRICLTCGLVHQISLGNLNLKCGYHLFGTDSFSKFEQIYFQGHVLRVYFQAIYISIFQVKIFLVED